MSRSAWNFTVDCVLAGLFLALLATASVVRFVFPIAVESSGWRVWGMGYDTWSTLHFVVLALFALTVLIHLLLHWTWIVGFVLARLASASGRKIRIAEAEKTLYGVAALIIALTGLSAFLFFAHISAQAPGHSAVLPAEVSR